jgi:hypothetical protein
MVLSLALVLAFVGVVFFFARPDPRTTEQTLREIDPSGDLRSVSETIPGLPVPTGLGDGWRATSATREGDGLRVGYVTPDYQYVEYAVRGADPGTFVVDQTGRGTRGGSLRIGDREWQVWSDGGGHTSLVLPGAGSTVVIGGLRETAEDEELQELAASLRP